MIKATLFGLLLSAIAISGAWALPASQTTGLKEFATSNVTEVGKRHWRHHRHRHWRHHHGKRHWRRGWYHGGRYWRHRYYYRPRHWWGCIHVGPVWYCP